MSWVEQLPSGRHKAVYRDDTGQRFSKTFAKKADARRWLAAADSDRARGQWVDPRGGAMLLEDWAGLWFASRTVRPSTHANDQARYRNHLQPAFGEVPLKDLSPIRIRTFVAQLGVRRAPGTVRHVHALLSTMLSDAVEEGLLLTNPCRKTTLPRAPKTEAVYLSPAQLELLAAAIDPHYRCLLLTAAGTGMRWGELTGLRRDRLDLLRRRLRIDQTLVDINGELSFGQPKTRGSARTVTLPDPVLQALSAHLVGHATDLVFTSPEGEPLRRSNFYHRVWIPAVRAARLQPAPRFHDLRHTHVALLIAAGVPIKAIQERPGHASIVMTMDRYGHLLESVDEDLLNALNSRLPQFGQ
ncbi:MAG: traSA:integrase fusion protein [Frankiales bacterium]|nr:traSA:integrase fusion protein [Frankiales bacterium]